MTPEIARRPSFHTSSTPSGSPTREIPGCKAVIAWRSRGRGTSAASRCMNSSGRMTKCVVPPRHRVLSFSTTCPAELICTRLSDSAGRVMERHSCSSRRRSRAFTHTAACRLTRRCRRKGTISPWPPAESCPSGSAPCAWREGRRRSADLRRVSRSAGRATFDPGRSGFNRSDWRVLHSIMIRMKEPLILRLQRSRGFRQALAGRGLQP